MKRGFDILMALLGLCLSSPLILIAVIGIWISSKGPIFYRASRIGIGGQEFEMLKFRSMHASSKGAVITAKGDSRIFKFGSIIRALKIDEIPQLYNVLKGDMSIVGPRPEDPKIVEKFYTPWMKETLQVKPGITSPGAVFYYIMGEDKIDVNFPEESYVKNMLPPKLAIELAYLSRANFLSDFAVILNTILAIIGEAVGFNASLPRRDMKAAEAWVSSTLFKDIA